MGRKDMNLSGARKGNYQRAAWLALSKSANDCYVRYLFSPTAENRALYVEARGKADAALEEYRKDTK
jgi:hypothetical protein